MNKFKVGDIVVGNEKSKYRKTIEGWKGRVISVIGEHLIEVQEFYGSKSYTVYSHCFDLVETETKMFKKLIATKEFLAQAFEYGNDYWRDRIRNIIKDDPFAESYTLTEDTLQEAISDSRICPIWIEKIKIYFGYESDDLYIFKDPIDNDLPFIVGDLLANPGEEFKCLIVKASYELIVDEHSTGHKILKFKKK